MSPLLLRYFKSTVSERECLNHIYKIATFTLLRANGEVLHQVVLSLDYNAHLKDIIPLTHEMTATVWHRGTLLELPSGEIVFSE